jgi:hypothetical protein
MKKTVLASVLICFLITGCKKNLSESSSTTGKEKTLSEQVTKVEKTASDTFKDTYTVSFENKKTTTFDVANTKSNFTKEMSFNSSLDMDPDGGADSYGNSGDHEDNYFYSYDFYNAVSTSTLTILPNYKTYQQTNESSCGVCSLLSALNYFGIQGNSTEESLWNERPKGTNHGSSLKQLLAVAKNYADSENYTIESTYDHYDSEKNLDGYFETEEGMHAIENYIKKGAPVIIGWNDWGGHYETVIGYDNMGTESIGDDVMIVADSYDTSDHCQDGYGVYGYERFFYNWTMYDFFSGSDVSYERDNLFLAIVPKTSPKVSSLPNPALLKNGTIVKSVTKKEGVGEDVYSLTFEDDSLYNYSVPSSHPDSRKDNSLNTALDRDPDGGADAYGNSGDHSDSYFYTEDFYNAGNTATRTILPHFKTYQQTDESTCGACATLMALDYLGKLGNLTETDIWDKRVSGTNHGSSLKQILSVLSTIDGISVDSTYDHYTGDHSTDNSYFQSEAFSHMIEDSIKKGAPVIIGWNDWGGHYETVIGYDNMGTESIGDDVMIVADSYDTSDHCQDGYGVYGYERFFYNWTMYDFFSGSDVSYERDYLFASVSLSK